MLVTTATSASTTLTASSRPPRPTSRTTASRFARAKSHSAASVPYSKYVSGTSARASSTALKAATSAASAATVAGDAHALVVREQVRRRCRGPCGDRRRAASTPGNAQVEPLPLVPATVITGHASVASRREYTSATRSNPMAIALGCSVSRYASQASSVCGRLMSERKWGQTRISALRPQTPPTQVEKRVRPFLLCPWSRSAIRQRAPAACRASRAGAAARRAAAAGRRSCRARPSP